MRKALSALLIAVLLSCAALGSAHLEETADIPSVLDPGGILFLVNRDCPLSQDYVPDFLIQPQVDTRKESLQDKITMIREAAEALESLFAAAMAEKGYRLQAVSGYRSYGAQSLLFYNKVQLVGSRVSAMLTVAPAGTSEHQTGLAMDIQCPSMPELSASFAETDEGQWVAQNAHRFGFIVRYKAEWAGITGYAYEPWHIRYVGIAHANAIHDMDIPLETYIACIRLLPEYVLTEGNPILLAGLVRTLQAGDTGIAEKLAAASGSSETEALRDATALFLKNDMTYEEAVRIGQPAPSPTSMPYTDRDTEEISLLTVKEE